MGTKPGILLEFCTAFCTAQIFRRSGSLKTENQLLHTQLKQLLAEARLNENKMRRLDQLEMRLIGTRSLSELIQILLQEYKLAYELDAVTLVLADPEYEIARFLESEQAGGSNMPGLVLLEKLYSDDTQPSLGAFDDERTSAIFVPWPSACLSKAKLPLLRGGELIGHLNLASAKPDRFTADSGTHFLERLSAIFCICLENALNHERLKQAGLTDPLTGVNNRRYFDCRCHDAVSHARRHDTPLACMFLDIDKFKRINDTLGHHAGDEVLCKVAHLIKLQLRSHDILARYGGEEFVVLLPQTALGQACEIAERIRITLAAHTFEIFAADNLAVTISIGVAMLPDAAGDEIDACTQKLVSAADAALYQAKTGGRNRVVCQTTDNADSVAADGKKGWNGLVLWKTKCKA